MNDLDLHLKRSDRPPQPADLDDFSLTDSGPNWLRFAIEADGAFVGTCVLHEMDRFNRRSQVGIWIGDPGMRGRGYGREALSLLIDVAFRYHNLRRLWLTVLADNESAIRCYQACGFVEEGRMREHDWVDGKYEDLVVMGLVAS